MQMGFYSRPILDSHHTGKYGRVVGVYGVSRVKTDRRQCKLWVGPLDSQWVPLLTSSRCL